MKKLRKRYLMISLLMIGILTSINNIKPTIIQAQQQSAMISQEEAERIALETIPGTIIRTELDTDDGITYFEIDIRTDTNIVEVYVNAFTSQVIEIDYDELPRNMRPSNFSNASTENNNNNNHVSSRETNTSQNNENNNVSSGEITTSQNNNNHASSEEADTSQNNNNVSIEETDIPQTSTLEQQTSNQGILSMQEAKEIALELAGGRVINTDFEHNIFNVYILEGVRIKEISIHAQTGSILEIDTYNLALIAGGTLFVIIPALWSINKVYKIYKKHSENN